MPRPRRNFRRFGRRLPGEPKPGNETLKHRGFSVRIDGKRHLVRFQTDPSGRIIEESIMVQQNPGRKKKPVFARAKGGLLDEVVRQLLAKKLR